MTKVFVLVVSLWGFNGDSWVFTGNQLFMKFEMNKYFTFKVQCIEDINKET